MENGNFSAMALSIHMQTQQKLIGFQSTYLGLAWAYLSCARENFAKSYTISDKNCIFLFEDK